MEMGTLSTNRVLQIARHVFRDSIRIESYRYAPCYLWYDRKIYDSFGRLTQTGCGNTFDFKNYKNGVYMVKVEIKEQFKTFMVYKE